MSWEPNQIYRTHFYQMHKCLLYTVFTNVRSMECSHWHKISNSPCLTSPCQSGHWLILLFMNRYIVILSSKEVPVNLSLGFLQQRTQKASTRARLTKSTTNSNWSKTIVRKLLQFLFTTLSGSEYTPTVSWFSFPDKIESPHFFIKQNWGQWIWGSFSKMTLFLL